MGTRRATGGRLCLIVLVTGFFTFSAKLSNADPSIIGDPMLLEFPDFQKEPETEPPAHPFDLVRAHGGEEDSRSRSDSQSADGGSQRRGALRGHKSLAVGALLLLLFVLLEGVARKDEMVHDVIVRPIRGTPVEALASRFSHPHLVADTGAMLLSAAASLVLGGLYENVADLLSRKHRSYREPYPLRGLIPVGVGIVLVLAALFNTLIAPDEYSFDPGDASLCLGFGLGLLLVGAGLLHNSRMHRRKGL
ncbi:hypothetical protein Emag_001132 [Eimeria magna]